jgi:hypothetical protein
MYEKRSRENQLTGEWIVYLPLENKNYYLTLGVHGRDQEVYNNVYTCFLEFPEVQKYLEKMAA